MKRLFIIGRPTLVLGIVLTMACTILVLISLVPAYVVPHAGLQAPASVAVAKLPAVTQSTKTAYADVMNRQLFNQDRRSSLPPPTMVKQLQTDVSAASSAVVRQGYTLVGTVISQRANFALLRAKNDAQLIRVAEGEELQGWRVTRVRRNSILLSAANEAEIIEFVKFGSQTSGR